MSWPFSCLWLSLEISCFPRNLSLQPHKTDSPKFGRNITAFCSKTEQGVPVEKGLFGEYMQVANINDGPVTFLLDSSRLC